MYFLQSFMTCLITLFDPALHAGFLSKREAASNLSIYLYKQGYGLAFVDPPRPVTNSTLFYTGSTTKSFTAAAMSLLVDDKETYPNLKWSSTIKSLLPEEFVTEDEYATSHLTIEDFLSHRSGFPRHDKSCKQHVRSSEVLQQTNLVAKGLGKPRKRL